ncbi:hypothetical protein G6N05_00410 [Flavobacterium sp. F372]|uniref:SGNH/GDSL hydrolase family protein n=1 Tax=Flavobacterium bernardetii TaxID=2813823 RepID=A0ABR7IU94_9FLAO|nr:hypothetical protein [Flavobacterium bernardetii]MBC5833334.1 hypothetical protein [Flavobacterium bernardetii]NHF68566.1 hypothetical protein [Flavobacterium bernardetii]
MLAISAYVLDYFYTNVFEKALPRTKFQNIRALGNESIDYVFLGSSRVENGISPEVIKNKTGKNAMNLGFQASKMSDIYLILQLLDEYKIKYKKAFIQVDYIFNIENGFSNVLSYEILPFIHENELISNHCQFNDNINFWRNKYLPFYRYSITSQKIGIREIFSNLIRKKTPILENKGYSPLYGHFSGGNYTLPETILQKNKYYDSMVNYSLKNKKEIIFFTAPFRILNNDFSFVQKLETKIPGLKNFSNELVDNKYFENNNHLNHQGAIAFTTILIEKLKL